VLHYQSLAKEGQVNRMLKSQCCPVRSIAMMAGVELLEDGNLISLACHLVDPYYYLTGGCVDPLCERGTVVACEAKSISVHPAGLLDDV